MTKRIYIGNLPFRATESDIRELLSRFGTLPRARESSAPRRARTMSTSHGLRSKPRPVQEYSAHNGPIAAASVRWPVCG